MPDRCTDTSAVGSTDDAITDRWAYHTATDCHPNRHAIGYADHTVAHRCPNIVCSNFIADNPSVHRAHSVWLLPYRDERARYVR
jgi:hypothetical protein